VRDEVLGLLGHPTPPPAYDSSNLQVEDLPADLKAVAEHIDTEISRLLSEKEQAEAAQALEQAAIFRKRAEHLGRTIKAMVQFWIVYRPIEASWLSWNNGTVLQLAQRVSQQHAWSDLPALADALEVAGCADTDLLDHCRHPGEHASFGHCWVVDTLLAKADRSGIR
jgi:hypothetical protein